MNAKTVKTIRRLARKLGLSYDYQKKIYKKLNGEERAQYLKDAKGHIEIT